MVTKVEKNYKIDTWLNPKYHMPINGQSAGKLRNEKNPQRLSSKLHYIIMDEDIVYSYMKV